MDLLLLRQLVKAAQKYRRNSRLDTSSIVIIALVGALVLISVIITFLVWLRYLVIAGLITMSTVTAIRWGRGDVPGLGQIAVEARGGDGMAGLEPDLEVPGRYMQWIRDDVAGSGRIDVQAEDGDCVTAPEPGLDIPGID